MERERRRNVRSIEIDQPIEVKFLDNSQHDVVLFAEKHALDQIDKVRRSDECGRSGGVGGGDNLKLNEGNDGTVEVVESVEEGNDKRIKRKIQTKKVVSEDPHTNSRITTVTKTETTEVTKVYVLKTDKDVQNARFELGAGLSEEELVPGRHVNLKSEWSRPRFIGGGTVVHRRSSPCLLSKCLRRSSVHEHPQKQAQQHPMSVKQQKRYSTHHQHRQEHPDYNVVDHDCESGSGSFAREPRLQQPRPMSTLIYDNDYDDDRRDGNGARKFSRVDSPGRFSNLCRCARSTNKKSKKPSLVIHDPSQFHEETIVAKGVKETPTKQSAKQSLSEAIKGKFSSPLGATRHSKYHPLIDDSQKEVLQQNNLQLSTYLFDLIEKANGFKNEEEAERAKKMIARSLDLLVYDRCDSWPDYKDQVCAENVEYDDAKDLVNPLSNTIEHIFTEYDTGDKLRSLIDSVPNDKLIGDVRLAANRQATPNSSQLNEQTKAKRKLSTSVEAIPTTTKIGKVGEGIHDKLVRPLAKSAKDIALAAGGSVAAPVAYVASIIKDHNNTGHHDKEPSSGDSKNTSNQNVSKKSPSQRQEPENVSEIIAEAMEGTPRLLTDPSLPTVSTDEPCKIIYDDLPDVLKYTGKKGKHTGSFIQAPSVNLQYDDRLPSNQQNAEANFKFPIMDAATTQPTNAQNIEVEAKHTAEGSGESKCFSCFGDKSKNDHSASGKKKKRSPGADETAEQLASIAEQKETKRTHKKCIAPCISSRKKDENEPDNEENRRRSSMCGTCLTKRKSSSSREHPLKEVDEHEPHCQCIPCFSRKKKQIRKENVSVSPPKTAVPEKQGKRKVDKPIKKRSSERRSHRNKCVACFGDKSKKLDDDEEFRSPHSRTKSLSDKKRLSLEPPSINLPSIDSRPDSRTSSLSKRFSVGGGGGSAATALYDLSKRPLIGRIVTDVRDLEPCNIELSTPTITTERDSVLVEQEGRIKQRGVTSPNDYISVHRSEQFDVFPGHTHYTSPLQVTHSSDGSKPPTVQFKVRRDEGVGPAYSTHIEDESSGIRSPKAQKEGQEMEDDDAHKTARHKHFIPSWLGGGKSKGDDGELVDDASGTPSSKRSGSKSRDPSSSRKHKWFGGGKGKGETGESSSGKDKEGHKSWLSGGKDNDKKKKDGEKDDQEADFVDKSPQKLKRIIDYHKNMMHPHGDVGDFYMHPDEQVVPQCRTELGPDLLDSEVPVSRAAGTIDGIRKMIDDHKGTGAGLATGAAIIAGIIDEHRTREGKPVQEERTTDTIPILSSSSSSEPIVEDEKHDDQPRPIIEFPAEETSQWSGSGDESKSDQPSPNEKLADDKKKANYGKVYHPLSEPIVGDFGTSNTSSSPGPKATIDATTKDGAGYFPSQEPGRYYEKPQLQGDYRGEPLHQAVESEEMPVRKDRSPRMRYPQSEIANIMAEHELPGVLIGQEARLRKEHHHGGASKCLTCFGSKSGGKGEEVHDERNAPKSRRRDKSAKRVQSDKSPHRVASIIQDASAGPSHDSGKTRPSSSLGPPSFRLPAMGMAAASAAAAPPLLYGAAKSRTSGIDEQEEDHERKKAKSKRATERSITADSSHVPMRGDGSGGESSRRGSRCFSCGRRSTDRCAPLVLSPECISILEYLRSLSSTNKLEKKLIDRFASQYPNESKSDISKIVRKAMDKLRAGSVPTLPVLKNQLKQDNAKCAHLVDPIVDVIRDLPAVSGAGALPEEVLDAIIADAKCGNPSLLMDSQLSHLPSIVKCAENALLTSTGLNKKDRKKASRLLKDAEDILKKQPMTNLNDLRSQLRKKHAKNDELVDMVVDELGRVISSGNVGGIGSGGTFSFQGPVKILINISHGSGTEARLESGGRRPAPFIGSCGQQQHAAPQALLSERADSNLRRNQNQLRQVIVNVLSEHEKRPQLSQSEIEGIVDKAFELLPTSSSFDSVTDALKSQYPENLHPLILSVGNLIEQAYFANEFESLDEKALALLKDRLSGKPLVLREISFNLPPNTTVCCCNCVCCRCVGVPPGPSSVQSFRHFGVGGLQYSSPHPTLDFTLTTMDEENKQKKHFYSSSSSSCFTAPSRSVSLGRGLTWREANERARILFYRGRQPAVRYNSLLHGFDVRMLLEQDGHVQEIPVSQTDVMRLLDSCGLHWDGNQISMLSAEDSDKILKRAEEEAFKILRETGFMRSKTGGGVVGGGGGVGTTSASTTTKQNDEKQH